MKNDILKRLPSRMTAIDLFSGCGGISCGLERAGFQVLAGIDVERDYLQTFQVNFPHAFSLVRDLSRTEPDTLMEEIGISSGALDLLAGGRLVRGFPKMFPAEAATWKTPKIN